MPKTAWKEPGFGAVCLSGRALTDWDTRMATIKSYKAQASKTAILGTYQDPKNFPYLDHIWHFPYSNDS